MNQVIELNRIYGQNYPNARRCMAISMIISTLFGSDIVYPTEVVGPVPFSMFARVISKIAM